MAYLDSGTKEHEDLYRCKQFLRSIRRVTSNIDVHAVADDFQEFLEEMFMEGLKDE